MIKFENIRWKNLLSTGNQWTHIDFTKYIDYHNILPNVIDEKSQSQFLTQSIENMEQV